MEAHPRVVVPARSLRRAAQEIVFTDVDLDEQTTRLALDEISLTGHELAQGRNEWASVPDPLLG